MIIDMRVRPPYGGYLDTLMYRNLPRTEGFSKRLGVYQPDSVRELSVEKMLREMEEAGIDRAVIPGRKANPDFGIVSNEDIGRFLELHPGHFIGMAGIDPLESGAPEEIETWVVQGPFKGIVMEPGVLRQPLYADDRRIYPIYAYCQEKGIPAALMVGGSAGPDVSYSMPAAVEHVAVDFPRLKILVYHGGWPWAAQMIHIAMRRGNIYLCPDMYMINTPGSGDYITAVNYTIPDRMVFGTAFPFVPFRAGLEFFLRCGIHEERMEDLLCNNAKALLGL